MKEIWVTQRKGQAVEHVLLPLAEYDAICVIVEAARAYTEVRGLDAQRNAYLKLVEALGKGKLGNEQEYDDGPWASTESDSCVDVAGYWHFPGPDMSGEAEVKAPIVIVPLKEGYVVENGEFKVGEAAFTNAVDLADWLLEWLGFEAEAKERVWGILSGKIGLLDELSLGREAVARVARSARGIHASAEDEYHKRIHRAGRWADHHLLLYKMEEDHEKVLGVAEAAQAYVEGVVAGEHTAEFAVAYDRMEEAVNKWRGGTDTDSQCTHCTDTGT